MFLKKIPWQKIIIFNLLAFVLCGLQTTVWFQLTPFFTAPNFYLMLVVFVALHRDPIPSFFENYLIGFVVHCFSVMPLGVLWIEIGLITLAAQIIKNRVFWEDWKYYSGACFGAIVIKNLLDPFLSWFFEIPTSVILGTRLIEIFFTTVFAPALYVVFMVIENKLSDSLGPEKDMVSLNG
jgi:hypothetical protein